MTRLAALWQRTSLLRAANARCASTSAQGTSAAPPEGSSAPAPPPEKAPTASSSSSSGPQIELVKLANGQLAPALPRALRPSRPLTPTHGVHVATLHLRSYDENVARLEFFTSFAARAARALALPTSGLARLPTRTSLFTVPRGPFAHKKSQENFWRREHRRAIKVYDGAEQAVQIWLAYLRRNTMGGVGMKAQLIRYRKPGWASPRAAIEGGSASKVAARQSKLSSSEASDPVAEAVKRELPKLKAAAEASDAAAAAMMESAGGGGEPKEATVVSGETAGPKKAAPKKRAPTRNTTPKA